MEVIMNYPQEDIDEFRLVAPQMNTHGLEKSAQAMLELHGWIVPVSDDPRTWRITPLGEKVLHGA